MREGDGIVTNCTSISLLAPEDRPLRDGERGLRTFMEKCSDARKLHIIGGPWNVEVVVHYILLYSENSA